MSISLNIHSPNGDSVYYSVAAGDEVQILWENVIDQLQFQYFGIAFSGGISITEDNYSDVLSELDELCSAIHRYNVSNNNEESAYCRCSRLRSLILLHPPINGIELWLG